jgi:predicted nucleic acid-binding protein
LIAFFDACAVIYRVESVEPYFSKLRTALTAMHAREPGIAVSRLSLMECRVLPLRKRQAGTLELYRDFFSSPGLRIVELDPAIVDRATMIRAESNLGTPDALQAASALSLPGEVLFITNDAKFQRVPGLKMELL